VWNEDQLLLIRVFDFSTTMPSSAPKHIAAAGQKVLILVVTMVGRSCCAINQALPCRQQNNFPQRRLRFKLHATFQFFHERFAAAHVIKAWCISLVVGN